MPEFFEEVAKIKAQMTFIKKNVKAIEDAYERHTWSSADGNHQRSEEIEELLDATNAAATQVRNNLKILKEQNENLPAESAQKKIRTNMHAVLSRKFMMDLQRYQTLQNTYREKCRERFQRQAEIVKPGVTREEVDNMLSQGGDYFSDKIFADQKHIAAKNALLTIQEQQRDLRHLEKSIQELNQLFLDMSTIVDQSNTPMRNIQVHMNQTATHTTIALHNVTKAEQYTMQRRRRVALLITAIVTFILLVFAVIGLAIAAKLGAFAAM